ncbi:MAG: hypothetical protein M1814_004680 [Vezdaea aestivalis]|nr:MAG: hypothetical protein M1814_004680 [Vezdaea aestivalis]
MAKRIAPSSPPAAKRRRGAQESDERDDVSPTRLRVSRSLPEITPTRPSRAPKPGVMTNPGLGQPTRLVIVPPAAGYLSVEGLKAAGAAAASPAPAPLPMLGRHKVQFAEPIVTGVVEPVAGPQGGLAEPRSSPVLLAEVAVTVPVKQPVVSLKQPAVSVKQPAVSVKQPAVSVKQPAVSVKQPAVSVKQPAVSMLMTPLTQVETPKTMTAIAELMALSGGTAPTEVLMEVFMRWADTEPETFGYLVGFYFQGRGLSDENLWGYRGCAWERKNPKRFQNLPAIAVPMKWADTNPEAFRNIVSNFLATWEDPNKVRNTSIGEKNPVTIALDYSGWRTLPFDIDPTLPYGHFWPLIPTKPPPMEVHCVPEEERHVGSDGTKYPYKWASAHGPAVRRDQERGPFGKSIRREENRKIRSKEPVNPGVLEGEKFFVEAAAKSRAAAVAKKQPASIREPDSQFSTEGSLTAADPTEVILFGYDADQQHAAIDKYERAFGRICEDYSRMPPQEYSKFPLAASTPDGKNGPRNQAEATKTMVFNGGTHWIKVTFENASFAHQACSNANPILIGGRRVYCEYYDGNGPREDRPISAMEATRPALAFTSSFATPDVRVPGSFATPEQNVSLSSSTASSATATGSVEPISQSRQRMMSNHRSASGKSDGASRSRNPSPTSSASPHLSRSSSNRVAKEPRRYLLDMRRRPIMPAHMALLPMPSFWQRQRARMPAWMTADIIGATIPMTEAGEFDWANASFYWKVCYKIDCILGTDLCAMNGDD